MKINEDICRYFQSKKGLREGDHLSSIMFNLIGDMLALLTERAKKDGQIKGVVPHLVDNGLSNLQYADDIILFMHHNVDLAKNMKLLLCVFEQLSGLKINFFKSEVFCYGQAKQFEQVYAQLFGCGLGQYPFRYLGIPMHHKRLTGK